MNHLPDNQTFATRAFNGLTLLIFVCGFVASIQAAPPRPTPKPDVILITLDTLRADHVGCYGDAQAKTPTLDALARDGVRFSQAFTPSPITNTSHASILTGLLPSSHGVTDFAIPLAGHATLAEILHQHGYKTAAFIGAVILDSKSLSPGFDRGFDFYDNFPAQNSADAATVSTTPKPRWGRVERRGMDVVAHAEKWLTAYPGGPHFIWVHLYDAHDPYEPPEPFATQFKDRPYDGEIAYADSALGHFVHFLKQRGSYDHSLIIAVGDHGEGLGEHQEETHGIFLYDSTTHVPLIMKPPSGPPSHTPKPSISKVVEAQVRTIDITPTVVDWLDLPASDHFDGESLKSTLHSKRQDTGEIANRIALGETDYPLRFGWAPLRSARSNGKKFIAAPRPEFYDLTSDPGETTNLFSLALTKDAAQALRSLLTPRKSESNANATTLPNLPDPKDKIEEQNLLHRAMIASEDGRPANARAALQKLLAQDANSPTALLQLGQIELAASNFAKAADYLHRARTVRPDDASAALDEGRARAKLGDNAAARDALETSLALHPGQLDARLLLGEVYLKLADPHAALDQFEAAGLLDSTSAAAKDGVRRAQLALESGPKK